MCYSLLDVHQEYGKGNTVAPSWQGQRQSKAWLQLEKQEVEQAKGQNNEYEEQRHRGTFKSKGPIWRISNEHWTNEIIVWDLQFAQMYSCTVCTRVLFHSCKHSCETTHTERHTHLHHAHWHIHTYTMNHTYTKQEQLEASHDCNCLCVVCVHVQSHPLTFSLCTQLIHSPFQMAISFITAFLIQQLLMHHLQHLLP